MHACTYTQTSTHTHTTHHMPNTPHTQTHTHHTHTHTPNPTTTTKPNTSSYIAGTCKVSGDLPPCPKPDSSYRSWRLKSCSLEWAVAGHILMTIVGKSRALGFSTVQTLRVCDRRHSPTSASLLTLLLGDSEDDGATKMKSNGAGCARILRSLLHRSVMVGRTPCGSLFLPERRLKFRLQYKCARK